MKKDTSRQENHAVFLPPLRVADSAQRRISDVFAIGKGAACDSLGNNAHAVILDAEGSNALA